MITGLALLAGAYLAVCEDVPAAAVEEMFAPIAPVLVNVWGMGPAIWEK